ncbi:hypothetical protein B0H13DRAFT_2102725 [Mycena leptocephala]|nr:hypothetical protein B0H13DRAFT_2102725 [Mycena leptocephala]
MMTSSSCETVQDPPGGSLVNQNCPILMIPPEITAEIFTHCLPDSISPPELDAAPLLLERICRDWRTIARDSPELWTSLKIHRSGFPAGLIETWLSRAQTLPLSLVLEVSTWEDEEWNAAPVVAVFGRHSQTWYDAFKNSPALRRLTLQLAIHPTLLQLPWTQITPFESQSYHSMPEQILAILQCTPNVVECTVAIHNESELHPLPDVAPLMFLTSLSFETGTTETMDIFDHISAPALQVLDFSHILFSGRELVARLHPILSKPDCQLRELRIRIDGDKPREDDFIALLQTQPALEKFELVEGSLGLLIAICRRLSDGSPFLPRLGSLTASPFIYPVAEITTTFPAMLDALVQALSTRWVAPSDSLAQIQNCTLSGFSGEMTDDFGHIIAAFRSQQQKELVALGINICVSE